MTLNELWNEEVQERGGSRSDYSRRRAVIRLAYGGEKYFEILRRMYETEEKSSQEIVDAIFEKTGEKITPRSIQRELTRHMKLRKIGDAFRLAVKKNRVVWHLKEVKTKTLRKMNPGLRMEILKRDKRKCQICGSKDFLEVDHKISLVKGGKTEKENLWVLCHECNAGKAILEKER